MNNFKLRPDEYKGEIAIDHHTDNHAFDSFLVDKYKISQSQFVSGRINFYSEATNSFNFSVMYIHKTGSVVESEKINISVVDFFQLFSNVQFEFAKK